MDNNEKKEKHKRQVKASGIKSQSSSVELRCKGCGKTESVTTTNILAYTIEVRNNHFCWKCKPPKSKVATPKKQIDQTKPVVVEKTTDEIIKDNPAFLSKSINLSIREDGVLRIGARFIEDYGFKGGDLCVVNLSNENIVITKAPIITKEMV